MIGGLWRYRLPQRFTLVRYFNRKLVPLWMARLPKFLLDVRRNLARQAAADRGVS
jgi:hypothetical protein